MNEEAAFLKAIAKNPKDETARLVFADWLQDRDDPRAPWVRDAIIWEWMKPDGKDPTAKLIARVRRGWSGAHILGRMGPTIVPALLAALPGIKQRGGWGIQYALHQIGPSAEPVLPLLFAPHFNTKTDRCGSGRSGASGG